MLSTRGEGIDLARHLSPPLGIITTPRLSQPEGSHEHHPTLELSLRPDAPSRTFAAWSAPRRARIACGRQHRHQPVGGWSEAAGLDRGRAVRGEHGELL